MSNLKILFTVGDVIKQIDRELLKLNITAVVDLTELKKLILARTIEDIRLVELIPTRCGPLELLADQIRSNYRRIVGDNLLTIDEDVSTNNSLPCIRSNDLSFQSQFKLYGHIVIIEPREGTASL